MKKNFQWMTGILAVVLILALTVGMSVLAEDVETPSVATEQTEDTQLQEAMDAYASAKRASRVSDLEEELTGMVEAGEITQEQSDLILKYVNDCASLQNGICPNCSYQFQSGTGNRMGGRGGKGRGMGTGFRMN